MTTFFFSEWIFGGISPQPRWLCIASSCVLGGFKAGNSWPALRSSWATLMEGEGLFVPQYQLWHFELGEGKNPFFEYFGGFCCWPAIWWGEHFVGIFLFVPKDPRKHIQRILLPLEQRLESSQRWNILASFMMPTPQEIAGLTKVLLTIIAPNNPPKRPRFSSGGSLWGGGAP